MRKVLSSYDWSKLVKAGKVEDLSTELPDGFLMVYQWMRAKVRLDGEIYFVSGWNPPGGGDPFVTLDSTGVGL